MTCRPCRTVNLIPNNLPVSLASSWPNFSPAHGSLTPANRNSLFQWYSSGRRSNSVWYDCVAIVVGWCSWPLLVDCFDLCCAGKWMAGSYRNMKVSNGIDTLVLGIENGVFNYTEDWHSLRHQRHRSLVDLSEIQGRGSGL